MATIRDMYDNGYSISDIADALQLTEAEVSAALVCTATFHWIDPATAATLAR